MENTIAAKPRKSTLLLILAIALPMLGIFLDTGAYFLVLNGYFHTGVQEAWRSTCQHMMTVSPIFNLLTYRGINYVLRHDLYYLMYAFNVAALCLPAVSALCSRGKVRKISVVFLLISAAIVLTQGLSYAINNFAKYFRMLDNPMALLFVSFLFLMECVLLVLMSIGMAGKKRRLMTFCFIFALVFAALSPLMALMSETFLYVSRGMPFRAVFYRPLPTIITCREWPVSRIVFFLLYAFISLNAARLIKAGPVEEPAAAVPSAAKVTADNFAGKTKTAAALLAFFLGGIGVHRYYLGYKGKGVVQTLGGVSRLLGIIIMIPAAAEENIPLLIIVVLLSMFGTATSIWSFVDFIRILTGGLWVEPGYAEFYKATYGDSAGTAGNGAYGVSSAQAISAPDTNTTMALLEKIADLHAQGILTDEEFEQKKAEILSKQ